MTPVNIGYRLLNSAFVGFICALIILSLSYPLAQAKTTATSSHLLALKAPDVPLNSPLLESFQNSSPSSHRPRHTLLRGHRWPIRNRLYYAEPQHGINDPRGFGPSVRSPYTVDPNGPNGPGMPGGSPLY